MKLGILMAVTALFSLSVSYADQETEIEIKNQKLKIIKVTTLEKKNQKEAEHLERENAKLLKELEALKAKVPVLEDSVKSLEGVVKAGRDENTRLKENIDEQKKRKAELEAKSSKLTKERNDLKDAYAHGLSDKSDLEKQEVLTKEEQGRLEKEIEKQKKELKALETLADSKVSLLGKSKDQLKNTKSGLAELKDKRDSLNKSIAEADEARRKTAEETQELQKEITRLKADINHVKIRVDVARQNQEDTANTHKLIAKEAAQLKETNLAENTKLKKIEEEVNDLQALIKTGKDEIEKAKKEYEGLTKRARQAKQDKPKLEAQLAQLKITYNELVEKNRQLRPKQ